VTRHTPLNDFYLRVPRMRERQYLGQRRESVFIDVFEKVGPLIIYLGVHAIALDCKIRG
jgi:hypothetical protein